MAATYIRELFDKNGRNSKGQPRRSVGTSCQEKDLLPSALSGARRERQNGLGAHAFGQLSGGRDGEVPAGGRKIALGLTYQTQTSVYARTGYAGGVLYEGIPQA